MFRVKSCFKQDRRFNLSRFNASAAACAFALDAHGSTCCGNWKCRFEHSVLSVRYCTTILVCFQPITNLHHRRRKTHIRDVKCSPLYFHPSLCTEYRTIQNIQKNSTEYFYRLNRTVITLNRTVVYHVITLSRSWSLALLSSRSPSCRCRAILECCGSNMNFFFILLTILIESYWSALNILHGTGESSSTLHL
jgi:hypothetical protein